MTGETCVLGIDPGLSGAIAFYFPGHPALSGVVSALGIQTHLVAPSRWKKHFRLSADKDEARGLALRLWPNSEHFSRKKDHGRAEAALIARYGAEEVQP
jgi:crossover junction endodeoxyribonuclease RuvC